MFYVYINFSKTFDRFYVGQTQNFEKRIELHNSGSVQSTKPYIPWENVCLITKTNRADAMQLERKLKNLNRVRTLQFISKYGLDAKGLDSDKP